MLSCVRRECREKYFVHKGKFMHKIAFSWGLILGGLTALGPLCTDFYLSALPEITEQLQATGTQTQLSLTSVLIGLGFGQLFWGPWSDRIGRRKPLVLSLLLFIFSSIMCAVTYDIYLLIVWRFLQGIAGAGGSVLSRSIARDRYQGNLLIQFFSLLMIVNGIAPVLGGYIITVFNWRILFWMMAGIGVVLLILSLLVLHETRLVKSTEPGQSPGLSVLKNSCFMRYCLIQAFMMTGLFCYIGSSSFVMQREYGMTAMQFSLLFGLNGIGLIVSSLIFSKLIQRMAAEPLMRCGLLLAVLCAAVTLLFVCFRLPVFALVSLFFTVSLIHGSQSGIASALMGTLMFVCGGIAVPLVGAGGESMVKMSLAIMISYVVALFISYCKK